MRYKVIFIDWDGTLSNSRFWERWNKSTATRGRYRAIQRVLFDSPDGKAIIHDWMTGLKSSDEILRFLYRTTGVPYGELESELRYSAENMTLIDDRVINEIKELQKSGTKVVIATDNMDTFSLFTVPALGLKSLFDGFLISDIQGSLKTNIDINGTSNFFGQYIEQNNIRPHESVLIDNSLDTKVVERLGIDFLHVNDTNDLYSHLKNINSIQRSSTQDFRV